MCVSISSLSIPSYMALLATFAPLQTRTIVSIYFEKESLDSKGQPTGE